MSEISIGPENRETKNLRRLAEEMRENAGQTNLVLYSEKLRKAAFEVDVQADLLVQFKHGCLKLRSTVSEKKRPKTHTAIHHSRLQDFVEFPRFPDGKFTSEDHLADLTGAATYPD